MQKMQSATKKKSPPLGEELGVMQQKTYDELRGEIPRGKV